LNCNWLHDLLIDLLASDCRVILCVRQALHRIADISKGSSLGRRLETSYLQHVGERAGGFVSLVKGLLGLRRRGILIGLSANGSRGSLWLLEH
jgi:hypothetical protein